MAPGLTKEEAKAVAKEALKEWMDERFMELGRWSLHLIFVALAAAAAYVILRSSGWQPPAEAFKPLKAVHP